MAGAEPDPGAAPPPTARRQWLALAAVGLGVSVAPLDSAVNVAFPAITRALSLDVSAIRWVIVCYVLTYASLLLGFGRLADLFGHRRIFVLGLLWAAAALVLCATADSFAELLFARVMQGVGAALVLSCGPALATLCVSEARRSQGVGLYLFSFSLATAVGPLLAGSLLSAWGWQAVFWFRVPLAVAALALALAVIPAALPAAARDSRLDAPGALALASGLACVLLAITQTGRGQWPALGVALLAAAGAAALYGFVRRQRQGALAIMELSVFRQPPFLTLNLTHVAVNGASFMVMLFVPFFLARLPGVDAALAGALFALSPLGFMLASPVGARALTRLGAFRLGAAGAVLNAAGLAAVAAWPAHAPLAQVSLALAVHGFGYGLFQVAALDVVMATVSRRHHGVAGALNMVTRTTGVVAGIAAGTLLFDAAGGSSPGPGNDAFLGAFGRVFALAAGVVTLCVPALLVQRGAPIRH